MFNPLLDIENLSVIDTYLNRSGKAVKSHGFNDISRQIILVVGLKEI